MKGHRFSAATHSLLLVATLSLSACVSVPEQFRGEYPDLSPQTATERDLGARIRWGGVILDTQPNQAQTCFELLSRPLGKSMRPEQSDRTLGRFIACKAGFYDPEVFVRGRELTLTGVITRIDFRKVGEFDYRYPIVEAGFVSMWPERQQVIYYEYDLFYSPYYWHYPYYGYPPGPPPRATPRTRDKGPRIDLPENSQGGFQQQGK